MEFEQLMMGDGLSAQMMKQDHSKNSTLNANPSQLSSDISHLSEASSTLDMGLPKHGSPEKKLHWLRSQIIGEDLELDSPFGKRRLTYADHTASGRSLRCIEDLIMRNVLPSYGNSHTSDSYVGHRTTKMVHESAKYIKKCLGGGEDDAIIFCGSGTTAAIKRLQEVMGLAVPSIMRDRVLKCLSVEERWVVFVGPYEHHSNLLSWRQSLAEVVEIGLDAHGSIDMEALRQELKRYKRSNRPILGSFSACSNVTGIYSDTRAIARLLHQNGGFACFDFAASGPYVKIDMRSGEIDGYDAIFLSPHKFIGGPGTPGVLLMNKILYRLRSSPPSTCGGGTVIYVNGFNERDTLYYEDIEERENGGTPQIIQTVRAALTFWVKEYIGYEVIEKYEHTYIERALERLLPNQNIGVLGSTSLKRQAVLSFLIYSTSNSSSSGPKNGSNTDAREIRPEELLTMWRETGNKKDKPLHGPFVAALLNDLFGIQARGGCACAGPYAHTLLNVDEAHSLAFRDAFLKGYGGVKPGWTRISFPYYMSEEEFEFTLAALEFIAIYGQRFLSLYHFDWRTGSWTFKKKALKLLLGKENNRNVHISSLAIASRAVNHEHYSPTASDDEEAKQIKTMKKYTTYLEAAKYTASLLPKFPPLRRLPEEIDANLVSFRV
ncbi:putative cysteine desulfurase [Morella rubra]|uniref:Putative cysteine desulfurase n=1 Tax=Morella rubra TaxID=262757 RepID=A0A6A1VHM8_9ROSI|nr:putative cysteine desulfurase [Morella rubra]